jgi:para-nitrobenzyl esterase
MPVTAVDRSYVALVTGKNIAVVNTVYGSVRGYIHDGIFTYKGIPYGTAGRFMPADKPTAWGGIRSTMAYGPTCPSISYPVLEDEFSFALQGSRGVPDENCLNLNIWTTTVSSDKKRPVMVWLHGGGFSSGSSLEFPCLDGENLSRTGDVIVVSLNHRLNVLGFLDLSPYGEQFKYSANVGLMDMVLALQWVKDNIERFGGDPDNVTLFGQSGGGTKVMALMNIPAAKGLFHKAIVQSGSSLVRILEDRVAQKVSAAVLKELGFKNDQVGSLITLPYQRLAIAAANAMTSVKKTLKPDEMSVFGLEWEPVHDRNYVPYQPHQPAAQELSKNIPLLVGSCKNEFMPFIPGTRDITLLQAKTRIKEKYGRYETAYMEAVEEAYPNTVKPSDYLDIDFLFRPLAINHADGKSKKGTAPVYMYHFERQSPVLDGAFKAMHNMDLPFVFNNIKKITEMTGGGQEAYCLAEKVSTAWINFAKNGDPNHMGLPEWPEYSTVDGATMIFDNTCIVKFHHDRKLLAIAEAAE